MFNIISKVNINFYYSIYVFSHFKFYKQSINQANLLILYYLALLLIKQAHSFSFLASISSISLLHYI